MARVQSPFGAQFRFRDFLDALRNRGRLEETKHYWQVFRDLYCPPLSFGQLLELPFDDLCEATSLLKTLSEKTVEPPRVFNRNNLFLISDTPGEWWLNKTRGKR